MKVLSQKEYEEKVKQKEHRPDNKILEPVPEATRGPVSDKKYYLFYPDNSSKRYHNGKYLVEDDGMTREYEITEGVIAVDSKRVSDILARQGFTFMYETKIGER